MTAQELYDATIEHFIRQGRPGMEIKNGKCRYRTKEGLKCAVGCHITDEEYKPSWDVGIGKTIYQIRLPERLREHKDLLYRLQGAHDDSVSDEGEFDWQILREEMKDVGEEFSLDTGQLSKIP